MVNKIIKMIAERLKAESPELFKEISKYAMYTGAAITIALLFPLPSVVVSVLTLLLGICAGLTGSAELTKK